MISPHRGSALDLRSSEAISSEAEALFEFTSRAKASALGAAFMALYPCSTYVKAHTGTYAHMYTDIYIYIHVYMYMFV